MWLHSSVDTPILSKGVGSRAQILAAMVLRLAADDPRLNLPNKRSQSMPNPSQLHALQKIRQLALSGVAAECA
ncbi:UNVERIFIED_CONTAM: hypothetical protein FKN15_073177 [Acipenser sinensis]